MAISLNKFVNVSIIHNPETSVNALRDTAVLFTPEGEEGQEAFTLTGLESWNSIARTPTAMEVEHGSISDDGDIYVIGANPSENHSTQIRARLLPTLIANPRFSYRLVYLKASDVESPTNPEGFESWTVNLITESKLYTRTYQVGNEIYKDFIVRQFWIDSEKTLHHVDDKATVLYARIDASSGLITYGVPLTNGTINSDYVSNSYLHMLANGSLVAGQTQTVLDVAQEEEEEGDYRLVANLPGTAPSTEDVTLFTTGDLFTLRILSIDYPAYTASLRVEIGTESPSLTWGVHPEDSFEVLGYSQTDPYVQMFFANGGSHLEVHPAVPSTGESIIAEIKKLPDERIVCAAVGIAMSDATAVAEYLDSLNTSAAVTAPNGIHRKLFAARATLRDILISPDTFVPGSAISSAIFSPSLDFDGFQSLIVKYSSVIGAEMATVAYLTVIDVYGSNTVKDYCYTPETIAADTYEESQIMVPTYDEKGNIVPDSEVETTLVTSVELNDIMADYLDKHHLNYNIELSGALREIGGDTMSGYSLVNEFMIIVLQQTLTSALLNTMMNKPMTSNLLSLLSATISNELNKYKTNGYLESGRTWASSDWIVSKNGVEYTVITQGTQLMNGFFYRILPFNSLTADERKKHVAPSIYIALADSYGVRRITVEGQVI